MKFCSGITTYLVIMGGLATLSYDSASLELCASAFKTIIPVVNRN